MGNISYTAHVSNKKNAITSKSKLAAVAKHNLRKYKSSDYSKDNICIIYGTSNLIDDVKTVYHKEFDEALEEYNKKQTRQDRKIEDYFEHVAGKEQDMAVEIIIQIGDREFWKQFDDIKSYMKLSYQIILDELRKRLPQFVVANAVVHLDEDSPHMHIVGVPVADGYKKGLSKQVSKRKVFTKDVLSRVLQDELREVANKEVNDWFGKQIKEKSKGRNHDLSVAEYKVAQETKHLTQLQEQVEESDRAVKANKAIEKEYTDKKEKLESDISCLESMRRITKSLSEMDSRESKQISMELDEKRAKLQLVNQELASAIDDGRKSLVIELRGALIQKALGIKTTVKKGMKCKSVYYDDSGKRCEREEVEIYEEEIYIPPDVAALNLALKNYDKENWANDPQLLELKREELRYKKEQDEKNNW